MSRRLFPVTALNKFRVSILGLGIAIALGLSLLSVSNVWQSVKAKARLAKVLPNPAAVISAPLVGGCATPSFAAAVNFGAGTIPRSVAVGDFNLDGKPDMAVVDPGSDNISVFLGNGAGSFGAATNFNAGASATALAIGDFNLDGKPDLATANNAGDDVSVLLGNGAGSFGAFIDYGTGMSPNAIAVGDFNLDGRPDVATSNAAGGNVSVLLGNGAGALGGPTNFNVGAIPTSVTVGDFNLDGKPDLAAANSTSNNISVLLGNGAGSFGAAANFNAGTNPNAVAVGDFNLDGKPDLAASNQSSANVSVLLGDGLGGFGAATNFTVGNAPRAIAVNDFNRDGKPDLAVANFNSNNVSLLLGNGAGSFGTATNFNVGTGPISLAADDFNLDEKPDLASANFNSNNASVLLNACNATPCGATSYGAAANFLAGTGPVSVAKADFNRDGRLDLAVANFSSNNVSVLLGNGTGGFGAATNFNVGTNPQSVTTADFNLDGRVDLVTANFNSEDVSVLLGNGTGGFGAAANFNVSGANPAWVEVSDFNLDGRPDLAVANLDFDSVTVRLGDGVGGFGAVNDFGVGTSPGSVAAGDFNQDGRPDLATANINSGNVSVLLGNGVGSFGAATNFNVGSDPASVKTADFNLDGRLDLVVANFASDNVSVLLGNGAGSFGAATNFNAGDDPLDVTVGDFNLDGRPDLAVANSISGNVSILLNNGLGGFGAATNYNTGPGADFVVAGDFNQDGSADLAVANYGDGGRPAQAAANRSPSGRFTPAEKLAGDGVSVLLNVCYAGAQTITVNTLADTVAADGFCSLREAIQAANTNAQVNECPPGAAGLDNITFNVGSGTPSIGVTSALPNITEPITINGSTGGATRIELNGTSAGTVSGITLAAGGSGSTIHSLVVNRFGNNGMTLSSVSNTVIQNCLIGTDAGGMTDLGNTVYGISITGGASNTIGGTSANSLNLISGNNNDGILISGSSNNFIEGNYIGTNAAGSGALGNGAMGINLTSSSFGNTIGGTSASRRNVISANASSGVNIALGSNNNFVQGNYIGLDAGGTLDLGNTNSGVRLTAANVINNVIGGTAAGARNVISGNNQNGVLFDLSNTNNRVEGNYIGLNSAGTAAIANSGSGVLIQNSDNITIGGTAAGAGNLISGNALGGITITGATAINNRVPGNSIFSNGALGIDLGNNGVTANDAGDPDTGANNLQNFPVLNFVTSGGFLSGSVDSTVANSAYPLRIEFFANTTCDASGNGEGEQFLGFVSVAAPGAFTFTFAPVGGKPFITATATDSNGNTSEFSACRMVGDAPAQTITVNTTMDINAADGFCSLTEAIQAANTNAQVNECNAGVSGLDNIVFNVGSGTPTISIASPMPTITEAVMIDGATGGATRIEINGGDQGAGVNGLTMTAGSSTIKSLVINRFTGNGILLSTNGGNTIQDCFIGVNAAGTAALPNSLDGIRINSIANNTIGGLTATPGTGLGNVISGNTGDGVEINGATATGNTILGNLIGLAAGGAAALGNGRGIFVTGAPSNTIGGSNSQARNIVSGNNVEGIEISGEAADNNVVASNYIGTDITGAADLGNGNDGVQITLGCDNSVIGGLTATPGTAPGNVISGNNEEGISIDALATTGHQVLGNIIGLNVAGTAALRNESDGILIINSPSNTIGGSSAQARNIISGNNQGTTDNGIELSGNDADNNVIQSNYIGTDITGTIALGNGGDGVATGAGDTNTIGGSTATPGTAPGNVISGNGSEGIQIDGSGNLVRGNIIGLNVTGTAALGNTSGGYFLNTGNNNVLGGATADLRNIISGNGSHGVQLDEGVVGVGDNNTVQSNYIGTDITGLIDLGNAGDGINLNAADGLVIGGATATPGQVPGNVISGNTGDGMQISTASAGSIFGNLIGLKVNGTEALPNSGHGIQIPCGDTNTVGGTAANQRNIISANGGNGIYVTCGNTGNAQGNVFQGNYIGTDITGTVDLGNTLAGVRIEGFANTNTVGGSAAGAGNLISGNDAQGVLIGTPNGVNAQANLTTVQGNLIGTQANGTSALANGGNGIEVNPFNPANANNTFGGTGAGESNTIAFNGGNGVSIANNVTRNRISGNSIHSNTLLGINLGPAGMTANDAGDGDTGANNLQNFPVLSSAVIIGGTASIQGTLNSTASTAFRIEFFSNPTCDAVGNGEGQIFLGFTDVTTNASGDAAFSASLPVSLTLGQVVTATATDPVGNTSEFSPCGCTFTLTPTAVGFAFAGGNGTVGVATTSGCSWTAVSNAPWITVTGGASGNGNGTVGYTVAANALTIPRTGSMTIAGFTFYVTQAAAGLILNEDFSGGIPPDWTVVDGGTGILSWTTGNPCDANPGAPIVPPFAIVDLSCAAEGTIPDEYLITPPFDASGLGQVILQFDSQFRIAPGPLHPIGEVDVSTDGGQNWINVLRLENVNDGPITRTVDITSVVSANPSNVRVRFHYFATVTRPAGPAAPTAQEISWVIDRPTLLALTVNLAASIVPPGGGSQMATVTAPADLTWEAISNANWITIASSGGRATGTGSGSFGYVVAPYEGACSRTGTITVEIPGGGQPPLLSVTRTVTQTGAGLSITPSTLPNGFVNVPYNQSLTASGSAPPYTFTVGSGTLPSGLSLSSGGVLSGTPTTAGTFNFTVNVADGQGCTGTKVYSLTIISGSGLQFYPLPSPVRLLETRVGFSGCNTPGLPIAENSTFTLPARTACVGVPANAAAVTGNITVVPSGAGYLTLFPSDAAQPTVANSNFGVGEITNNVFTVGLGATGPDAGAFKIFSSAATEVIIDVTGYYAPPSPTGLFFHPLATPVRLLETRTGFTGCFAPGTPLNGTGDPNADPNQDLELQGRSPIPSPCNSIPATAQVLVGNATSVLPSGGGYLTIYPSGGTRPTVASSNYAGGDVINGPFAVKLGADGKFKIYTFATTHLVVDILGYYSEDATDVNGAGLFFNPLPSPVRLLETRPDFPGFPLTGCTRTNAKIPGDLTLATHTQSAGGFCGLPASAQAVVGNVSVVNSEGAGFLTLFPGNLTTAPLVATSNYPAPATFGYNRHYFVGLSPVDGKFKVLTQFTTDLILDASGYFAP